MERYVLVTGGAGFLGINLIRTLLARGYRVRSMDIAPFDYPEQDQVDVMQCDIRDRDAVAHAMRDAVLVVHCAAALPRSSPREIQSTDVGGTRVLLEAARARRVDRFVFISSTSVYGIPDHHPLVEDDRLHGVGPYGEAKIEAEASCTESRRQGLCTVILRPKTFVGPERLGAFELLYEWAFTGRNFPVLGSGDNLYQLLDVADLCEVILLCLTRPMSGPDYIFNVGAAEFGTLRQAFQSVLDRAGHGKRIVSLPVAPSIAMLWLLERLHLSPLYEWIYQSASHDSYVSTDRLQSRLGFRSRYSNSAALLRNYDWYVAHRGDYLGRTGVTHRLPWRKGALELVKWLF